MPNVLYTLKESIMSYLPFFLFTLSDFCTIKTHNFKTYFFFLKVNGFTIVSTEKYATSGTARNNTKPEGFLVSKLKDAERVKCPGPTPFPKS